MKQKLMTVLMLFMCGLGLYAAPVSSGTVGARAGAIVIDGMLDDPGWQAVRSYGGFIHTEMADGCRPAVHGTEFKILADENAVYFAVRCSEPNTAALNKNPRAPLWTSRSENVEIFLSPSGDPDTFYQFVVSSGNNRYAMYYGEGGQIKPDLYGPGWKSAVAYGKNCWTIEIRIPLAAFYMTRNRHWSSSWLVNVGRIRQREISSWSRMRTGFHESSRFRMLTGFPSRRASEDFCVHMVKFFSSGFDGKAYHGKLSLEIQAEKQATGLRQIIVKSEDGFRAEKTAELSAGMNVVDFDQVKISRRPGKPAEKMLETVIEIPGNAPIQRFYPCEIEYIPLSVTLTNPRYRDSFYPGQKSDSISGRLLVNAPGAVRARITAKGANTPMRKTVCNLRNRKGSFSLKGIRLPEGSSLTLSVEALGADGKVLAGKTLPVKRPALPKTVRNPGWVADGSYVLNGKKIVPCYIYAVYYMGGRKFREKFDRDDLGMVPFKMCYMQENRIARPEEYFKDGEPSAATLEKVRRRVTEALASQDFHVYYLSDEPECRQISWQFLKKIYDLLKELDPFHPVVITSRNPKNFRDCCDIIMVHPYINPVLSNEGKRDYGRPVADTRRYVRSAVGDMNFRDKAVGFLGQWFCTTRRNGSFSYPTFAELEATTWSALANGSRILFPYAYHDLGDRPQLYEGFRYFNTSAKALSPWLLSDRHLKFSSSLPADYSDVMFVEADGVQLLTVVNLVPERISGSITAETLKKIGRLYEFRGSRKFHPVKGTLNLKLAPYEVLVLTSRPVDGGLVKRDAVLKDIRRQHKERENRGNLLYERGFNNLELATSNTDGSLTYERQKLFDGTLDVYAWASARRAAENFIELEFPERSPAFSRIEIYGDEIGDASARIWKFGKWIRPETAGVERNDGKVVIRYTEPQTTVKLRLDFGPTPRGKFLSIEVYEIELHK